MPVSKTSYSIGVGGEAGYINIGGWNTTLTDVQTQAQEVCGITRYEGSNKYMYALNNASTQYRGAFVTIGTAQTDGGATGAVAPITFTSYATSSGTSVGRVFGMVVPTNVSTQQYCWILRQGITTCYAATNTGFNVAGEFLLPSVATAHVFSHSTTNTAVAYVLDPVASATAACGSAGALCFVNFEAQIASP